MEITLFLHTSYTIQNDLVVQKNTKILKEEAINYNGTIQGRNDRNFFGMRKYVEA